MLNSWSVAKFGGTSMADANAIRRSAKVVSLKDNVGIVVVSATSGTTNDLLALVEKSQQDQWQEAEALLKSIRDKHLAIAESLAMTEEELEPILKTLKELETIARGVFLLKDPILKVVDRILSIGERISSHLMLKALRELNYKNPQILDARSIIKTSDQYGKAQPSIQKIEQLCIEQLIPRLQEGVCYVTQGFIGSTEDGFTTTLGRGGSDYSASLFGEGVKASEVQIWTDVSGVATTDPRLCPKASAIRELSFSEAAELATFGAKVLHPTTLWPAMRKEIPVFVGNSMRPEDPGTWIRSQVGEKPLVRAIAMRKNQSLLTLTTPRMLHTHGFLAKVFQVFDAYKVSVDLITTSEISISITVEDSTILNKRMLEDLSQFAELQVDRDLCLISLIGNNIHSTPGLSAEVFQEIRDVNIRMVCVGASQHNLGFLINSDDADSVLKKLHKKFLE